MWAEITALFFTATEKFAASNFTAIETGILGVVILTAVSFAGTFSPRKM